MTMLSTLSRTLLLILISISIGTHTLFSQAAVDSLLEILNQSATDTVKVDALLQLAWAVEKENPTAAIMHLDEAIRLADTLDYDKGLARACNDKGVMLWYNMGEYDKALECNRKAFKIYDEIGDKHGVANTYHTLANITEMKGDFDQALTNHLEALRIREEINDEYGIAWSCINLGVTYSKMGQYDKALEFKKRSLEIYEELGQVDGMANVYNNMGIIYSKKGMYKESMESYLSCLKIREEVGDEKGMFAVYSNIAELFIEQEDLERALSYLNRSLKLKTARESKVGMARTFEQMARIKEVQKEYEEAKRLYKEALNLYTQMENKLWIGSGLLSLGRIYNELGDVNNALITLNQAIAVQEEIKDKQGNLETALELGGLYLKTGDLNQAERYLERGRSLAVDIGAAVFEKNAYDKLADLYAEKQEFEKAFLFREEYEKLNDSLFNDAMTKSIIGLKAQYDIYEKERQIQELKQKDRITELTWYGVSIALGGIIILSLMGIFIMRFRTQQKSNRLLSVQKTEIETKNRELALSNLELEQFAHVVSHDLKQPLRTIANYTDLIEKKYVDQLDKHGREYVGLVTDGVKNMHTLISDLLEYSQVARSETGKELVDLNEIVNQVVQSLDSQISEADAEVEVAVLPHLEASRTAMTQLFQNLISNAIKFKQDGVDPRVKIEYWTEGKNHVFSVEDNGIGISPRYFEKVFMAFHRLHTKEKYQGTGIGLAICQKIVLNLNGKIWVESTPGQGSRFFFSLPVSQSGI